MIQKPKIDPRVRRTRDMIFHALNDLLAERAFDDISVQDIAERSTVNRATVYDHFKDKDALVEEMIGEQFVQAFEARMAETPGTCPMAIRQLVLTVCDFLDRLQCPRVEGQFARICETKIREIVREFLVERFRSQPDSTEPELRASLASWAICGAAREWSRDSSRCREQFTDSVLPLLMPTLTAACGSRNTEGTVREKGKDASKTHRSNRHPTTV